MSADQPAMRDLGLDAMRALSIGLVLLSHVLMFFPYGPLLLLIVEYCGWLGVEMFFSLSGLLIGRIMLALAEGPLDRTTVATFLARRWLRTLPLYYVVLLALVANRWPISWVDTFLAHGFVNSSQWVMAPAWSLAVEEFFYLTFPLLMTGLVRAGVVRGRSAVAVTAGAMMAAGFLFRLVFWFGVHPLDYRLEWFRYNPLLRIDACAFGVMLACVLRGRAAWRPSPRARLMLFGGFVAAAAAGVVFLRALPMVGELEHKMALRVMLAFYHVAYWPALDLAALGAMLALLGVWPGRRGVLAAVIRFFSRTSYGLYLIHLPVFAIVPVYTSGLVPEGAATLALVLGVTLLLASLGYRLIEAPILAWRDRRLPVGGAARAASVVPAAVVEASVP